MGILPEISNYYRLWVSVGIFPDCLAYRLPVNSYCDVDEIICLWTSDYNVKL